MLFIKACRHYGLMKDKSKHEDDEEGGNKGKIAKNAVIIGKNLNIDLDI